MELHRLVVMAELQADVSFFLSAGLIINSNQTFDLKYFNQCPMLV